MNLQSTNIKSKERVRDIAEVFTAKKQVEDMLDLVKDYSENIEGTFLEPACGNGNFLIAILERKLKTVLFTTKNPKYKSQELLEFLLIKTISSIYGIDIMQDNILEARERLKVGLKNFFYENFNTRKHTQNFWQIVDWILEQNIVLGDSLNHPDKILFLEYKTPKQLYFKLKQFYLEKPKNSDSLFEELPSPKIFPICHYLHLNTISH